jgi:hypothetical protein
VVNFDTKGIFTSTRAKLLKFNFSASKFPELLITLPKQPTELKTTKNATINTAVIAFFHETTPI